MIMKLVLSAIASLLLLFVLEEVFGRVVDKNRRITFERWLLYCALLGLALFLAMAVSTLPKLPDTALQRVAVGMVLVAGLSAGMFWVKIRGLRVYAVVEIGFALCVAGQTLYGLGDFIEPVQSLSLLASVYLLIRGMDNFKKDLDSRKTTLKSIRATPIHTP